ncbi:L-rhamnose isomerase [Shigella flexneri]
MEWAKANKLGLDLNLWCLQHPLSADGVTLATPTTTSVSSGFTTVKASRRVSAYFGEQLGTPSVMNIGFRQRHEGHHCRPTGPRQRLLAALDEAISEKLDPAYHIDAVESKLFASAQRRHRRLKRVLHEDATSRQTALRPDAGYFHPTEAYLRRFLRRHALRATPAAARQPSGALGQRPRSPAG